MIDCVYFNNELRCFRNGIVERWYRNKYWKRVKNTANQHGYNKIDIDTKPIRRHRLIAFCFLGLASIIGKSGRDDVIDHKDRNKLNNCVDNLRITTQLGNNQNKICKGYYFDKQREKFCAHIKTNGYSRYLGLYDTEDEAHQAYLDAKQTYHLI